MTMTTEVPTTTTTGAQGTPSAIQTRVREFVLTNFYVANPATLSDQASLLDTGVIDSTGVLEVIAFVESEFGVQVADEEIVPDNLDSIERIGAFVARKQTAS